MSEVHVPFGDSQADTATLLLAAAEETKGVEANSVRVDHFAGTFVVPEEVAKKAGLDTVDPDAEFNAEIEKARKQGELESQSVTNEEAEVKAMQAETADDTPPPAKKTAAKKTAAKKTAAKKTTAKKTTAKKAS